MTVIAKINVETQAGRNIVRELEKHKKLVELHYESPELVNGVPVGYITLEEGVNYFWEQLEKKFGYDIRKNKK